MTLHKHTYFKKLALLSGTLLVLVAVQSCQKDIPEIEVPEDLGPPIPLFLEIPQGFPNPLLPSDNPLTEQGVALGRQLFYDPILSKDGTISCGSCHDQSASFSDQDLAFSLGVDDREGDRNAMAIINPAWQTDFFWDGRSPTLEKQALEPVPNPVEMHLSWPEAIEKLQAHPKYPAMFENVFGTDEIDSNMVAKAIEQFELTLISSDSRYDQFERFELVLTEQERAGQVIFFTEKGDCFHCHGSYPFLMDNLFHNNGLDLNYADKGLGKLTGNPEDNGKFRTPTLRNIALTAPYMHDGRFATLEEVIDHYSSGIKPHANIDPLFKQVDQGGVQLSPQEKKDLLAFLHTFTDETFLTNPAYSDPNKD